MTQATNNTKSFTPALSQALKEVEKWKGVVTAIKMSIPNE